MLKLSKGNKRGEVTLSLRDREGLLSRSFFIALAIAFGLHIFGLLIFHIQPFRIGNELKHYPPAIVDADAGFDPYDTFISADLESYNKKMRTHLAPSEALPLLPSTPPLFISSSFHQEVFFPVRTNPFLSIEQEIFPDFLVKSETRTYQPLTIRFFGLLRDLAQVEENKAVHYVHHPLKEYCALYEAQTYQGQIFWYKLKQSYGDKQLQQKGEEVLLQLSFKDEATIARGTVEITLYEEM